MHAKAACSAKFQRKLDAALGTGKEDDFYTMETPLLSREDHERVQEAISPTRKFCPRSRGVPRFAGVLEPRDRI